MNGSWRTSTAGLGAIHIALGSALSAQFDSDPTTLPDWGATIAAIIAGVGLFAARDKNVTSEQQGVK